MNEIDKKLADIGRGENIGLMTHVVVGYPTLEQTISLVKAMEKAGSDFVELQIPFSDPLADGTTIMRACEKALASGIQVKDAFATAKILAKQVSIPLVFMAYYNTIFQYGVSRFCKDAKEVGVSGLIIPDMPLEEEEREHFIKNCTKNLLHHIRVISPASTLKRLIKNAAVARGFVYCTARQGITGAKDTLDSSMESYLKMVKKYFSIPLAVGFGISKKEHIQAISPYADIVVVGSAFIDIINQSKNDVEKDVERFIKSLKV